MAKTKLIHYTRVQTGDTALTMTESAWEKLKAKFPVAFKRDYRYLKTEEVEGGEDTVKAPPTPRAEKTRAEALPPGDEPAAEDGKAADQTPPGPAPTGKKAKA